MCKSIDAYSQRQLGGTITAVYINIILHCTWKDKQSEVEVVIMETNRKRFLLTCGKLLMEGGILHKDLGTLSHTTSA